MLRRLSRSIARSTYPKSTGNGHDYQDDSQRRAGRWCCRLALAGTAQADSNDDLYIRALNAVGAGTNRAPREQLIRIGHAVCSDLNNGKTPIEEMKGLFANVNLTQEQATMLVVAAVDAYCPEYKSELQTE